MKVAVVGATGRMGKLVIAEVLDAPDLTLVAAMGSPGSAHLGRDVGVVVGRGPIGVDVVPVAPIAADVWIDFSLPAGLAAALHNIPPGVALVTGTTGVDDGLRARLRAAAASRPVLAAANFSTGVALLRALVRMAASALPTADVELVETHHRHKRDAPSGTALALAHDVAHARGVELDALLVHGRSGETGPREAGRIAIHAMRGGDVTGDHTVWLALDGETIALSHRATARTTFAHGALRAARWLPSQPAGLYEMDDVLGLTRS
ncbi:MAG: 4-hydroxy-tetrahydrodipicolinate reductase [Myxococcota bacterium]|jgi:4-hydroxy-tetrahydrodipicolinate reductase